MKPDFYPEKAQYKTNEPVHLIVDHIENCTGILKIFRLHQLILEEEICLLENVPIFAGCYSVEFEGYGAELTLESSGKELCLTTAFDVCSESSRVIRYGFLSDFGIVEKDTDDVALMRRWHLNFIQFYDWSYRHDDLAPDKEQYSDMMGRQVDRQSVRAKIKECKKYGMKCMGYGAVYASSQSYWENHQDEGLYTSTGDPLVFIDRFYLMNVEKSCPWHAHIISEYAKALRKVGFDGIHMDTYGFPKTAFTRDQRLLHMQDHYGGLIEDSKMKLSAVQKENYLIFNNVGNWPVAPVAESPQNAIYIEVWDPYTTYAHLRQIITEARIYCKDKKPVVLAAYLMSFRNSEEQAALNSARFLLAGTISCGASNLLFGEKNAVLTQGYYPDYSRLNDMQTKILRNYMDFMVRYESLFYDRTLKDVSFTHIGWDNTEYSCMSHRWSPDGQSDTLWLTLREKDDLKLISIVNLYGCDNVWNRGKESPEVQFEICFQVQVDEVPSGIYMASPDETPAMTGLEYPVQETSRGRVVSFVIPKVMYWTVVVIRF